MGKIIGIDLGTTNSCLAIMEGGEAKVLVNEEGERTTPSVVAFDKNGNKLVGQVAKRQAITNPENTIFSAKRFIGQPFPSVVKELTRYPFTVKQKEGKEDCCFVVQGKNISPEEISASILAKIKKTAEDYLGEEVTSAVITVPAYFNDAQRQSTKDAGRIAGLKVERIINEPTAAALSYGLDKKGKDAKVAFFDFGGGTFDISVLEVSDNLVEVKATNGDAQLGGDDFDNAILDWMAKEFKASDGVDLLKDKMALQRLKEAAEKAKKELSSTEETEINLPFVTADNTGPKHLNLKLSRAKFEQMVQPLIEKAMVPCQKALDDAKLTVDEIEEVILVGGTTRIPAIQKAVKDFFKKEPNKTLNPDEVVALGAAIQGGVLAGDIKDVLLLDVNPLSLGIETLGGVMTKLIDRNTTVPVKKSQVFSTAADNQPNVDIHVLQGEREMAADNKTLGRFELQGIPAAPRGVPQIEVTFDIDANGIINVSAKDKSTQKEQKIQITSKTGLSEEEIEKMVKDAEVHADDDRKKKETISLRNELDNLIYQLEKLEKENGDKLKEEHKKAIPDAIKEAKECFNNVDSSKEAYEEQKEKLEALMKDVTTHVYQQAQQAGNGAAGNGADAGAQGEEAAKGDKKEDDDVIDAQYKNVD